MCRLLGVVSARPTSISRALGAELEHFVKASMNRPDGWGAAYVSTSGSLVVVKQPKSVINSSSFNSLVSIQRTDAVILNLPRAGRTGHAGPGEIQPFSDGLTALAHSGRFTPVTAIDGALDLASIATLEGRTYSERYYRLVRRLIQTGADPAEALLGAAAAVRASAESYESLNCLLLTSDALYAYADHDPEAKVLHRYGIDFFDIRFRVERNRVTVSSTSPQHMLRGSERLEPRHVLRIDRSDLRVDIVGGRVGSPVC
jgi:predicted glutamine amidotransferase